MGEIVVLTIAVVALGVILWGFYYIALEALRLLLETVHALSGWLLRKIRFG